MSPTEEVVVSPAKDHVLSLAKCKPSDAIEELIWNSLDAGSTEIEISISANEIGAVTSIQVSDNGSGISRQNASKHFGQLGGSEKQLSPLSEGERPKHGSQGRGRLKAMSMGREVTWHTAFEDEGRLFEYQLHLSRANPTVVTITTPTEVSGGRSKGTTVIVKNPLPESDVLAIDSVHEDVLLPFALFLTKYPGITIKWNKIIYTVDSVLDVKEEVQLTDQAELRVLFWSRKIGENRLYLCDSNGVALAELPLQVDTSGFHCIACLCSEEVSAWKKAGTIQVAELDKESSALISQARKEFKRIVSQRLEDDRLELIHQWKEEGVYPYTKEEESNKDTIAERTTFDVVVLKVADHHKPLKTGSKDAKHFTLSLIRQALETNPSSLMNVFRSVLKLSPEELDEFSDLLTRTDLSSVIKASRLVADRLDLIHAFSELVFGKDFRQRLLERTQLHRLLVHESWLFGEEFTLLADDDTLEKVLEKHIHYLGREKVAPEVNDLESIELESLIPDLMFGKQLMRDSQVFEHLIVELKRPKRRLDQECLSQIEGYAHAVSSDARFDTDKVKWRFVLLGSEVDDFVKRQTSQNNLPPGCTRDYGRVTVWARTWSDFLIEAKSRYEFFRDRLAVRGSSQKGIDLLHREYPHLMTGKGASKKRDLEVTGSKQA